MLLFSRSGLTRSKTASRFDARRWAKNIKSIGILTALILSAIVAQGSSVKADYSYNLLDIGADAYVFTGGTHITGDTLFIDGTATFHIPSPSQYGSAQLSAIIRCDACLNSSDLMAPQFFGYLFAGRADHTYLFSQYTALNLLSTVFASQDGLNFTFSGSGYSISAPTLTSGTAVLGTPGPIAGAGLFPLLGLAAAYLFGRRRLAA